jgi:glycosyltransferase involved in cell wall biosynthesis
MTGITIIIPCYNETLKILKETIFKTESSLKRVEDLHYEIIVVNDGSRFNYDEMNSSHVSIINHERNKGYGAGLKTGIRNAKYDYIGIADSDATYPVDKFDVLIKNLDDYDMIVGARNWKHISWLRKFPKYILTKFASFLANYKIPDLNSGMRIFRKETALEFWKLYPDGFSFTSTITMGFITKGYSVKYLPIDYFKREGKSSIHPIKDTIGFFSLVSRLTLYFNPLRVFIPLTFFILLLAISRGLRDYLLLGSFGGLTLVLFFMSFQVFFFGLIAEIINKK